MKKIILKVFIKLFLIVLLFYVKIDFPKHLRGQDLEDQQLKEKEKISFFFLH